MLEVLYHNCSSFVHFFNGCHWSTHLFVCPSLCPSVSLSICLTTPHFLFVCPVLLILFLFFVHALCLQVWPIVSARGSCIHWLGCVYLAVLYIFVFDFNSYLYRRTLFLLSTLTLPLTHLFACCCWCYPLPDPWSLWHLLARLSLPSSFVRSHAVISLFLLCLLVHPLGFATYIFD